MTTTNTKIAQWTLKGLMWLQAQGWISVDRTVQVLKDLPIDKRTLQIAVARAKVAMPPNRSTNVQHRS